ERPGRRAGAGHPGQRGGAGRGAAARGLPARFATADRRAHPHGAPRRARRRRGRGVLLRHLSRLHHGTGPLRGRRRQRSVDGVSHGLAAPAQSWSTAIPMTVTMVPTMAAAATRSPRNASPSGMANMGAVDESTVATATPAWRMPATNMIELIAVRPPRARNLQAASDP